ncbi:SWIM zinc finger family protein [Bacillus niameyensis]|uniref:SWIM zinc finger family protein n=1 Tax=Bacillus niameyensis TaxID=1522308 RepID=UPI0007851ECC|nr:SWIM zinc finger family protein [Bacillus niameyensis]
MNIHNFDKHISETIIQRGYDYYRDGNVIEVFTSQEGEYIFTVVGTEDYEVVIKLGKSEKIESSDCTCPYDFGKYCKHEVAALFELRELMGTSKSPKVQKSINLIDVLAQLSKEEMINIIKELAEKEPYLEEQIIFQYSKGNDEQEIENGKRLINSIVSNYTGRKGFIPYGEVYSFTCEMDEVLEKANILNGILISLEITLCVLSEAIEAFQYADDSDGFIGGLVNDSIEQVRNLVVGCEESDFSLREDAFQKIIDLSESDIFDGWEEFKIDLLWTCIGFADHEIFRNKLRDKITKLLEEKDSVYYQESLLQLLFAMIEQYGTEEEVEQFMQDHLMYASFRKSYIEKRMYEKNYQKAIELAEEGEENDKQLPGRVNDWKKLRYQAYEALGLKKEQEKLAKELLFAGNFEYYHDLKELVAEDFSTFYNNLKGEIQHASGWSKQSIYLQLIEEENDQEALLDYVQKNPSTIESYMDRLIDTYKDEIIEIYTAHIQSMAQSSSNRKQYRQVCRTLKSFAKIAGKGKKDELRNDFRILYARKPAFLDELGKV